MGFTPPPSFDPYDFGGKRSDSGPAGNGDSPWNGENPLMQHGDRRGDRPSYSTTTTNPDGTTVVNNYYIKEANFMGPDAMQRAPSGGYDWRQNPEYATGARSPYDFRYADQNFNALQQQQMQNYFRAAYIPPQDNNWMAQQGREQNYNTWAAEQMAENSWNPNYQQWGGAPPYYGGGQRFARHVPHNPFSSYNPGVNVEAGNGGLNIQFRIGGNHHRFC